MIPPHGTPGLRQRKKDHLRAQIIEAGVRQFVERGYHETTVDDIVAGLEISTRTFFRYFESKEDLVVAGPLQPGSRLRDFAATAPAGLPALQVARQAVRRLAEYRQALPDGLRRATLIVETPELAARLARERDQWGRDLAAVLRGRLAGPDADLHAATIAAVALGTLAAAFERWVAERGARPLPELLDLAFALADREHAALAQADDALAKLQDAVAG